MVTIRNWSVGTLARIVGNYDSYQLVKYLRPHTRGAMATAARGRPVRIGQLPTGQNACLPT